MENPNQFLYSQDQEPHKKRTREIIQKFPQIRQLIGKNPYTFLILSFVVIVQFVAAFLVKDLAWYWMVLSAYVFGAFASHTLFICVHESAHNLIFENRVMNTISGIIANIPQVFPSAVSFQKYHLKHHAFQGVPELDADIPSEWEGKLGGNNFFVKASWLLIYPIVQMLRPLRTKEIKIWDNWVMLNWAVQLVTMTAVVYFWGWMALAYLTISLFFSIGLHPLGARWIQEHFLTSGDQETHSYYGILNTVNLNVGFHNEHHDFPSIPWNKLPKIKEIATVHYDTLQYHLSYTKLLLRFLFDSKLSIYSRTIRENRGNMQAKDKYKTELDLARV